MAQVLAVPGDVRHGFSSLGHFNHDFGRITGIAATIKGNILLCDYDKKNLILVDPLGNYLKKLNLDSEPYDIAITSQNIGNITLPKSRAILQIDPDRMMELFQATCNDLNTTVPCVSAVPNTGRDYSRMSPCYFGVNNDGCLYVGAANYELMYGLGSLLEVVCQICSGMKLVSTGKWNGKGAFDINSKVALAMMHSGMGPEHVVNFLSTCNIPPPDPKTLKKKEKCIALSLMDEASDSCKTASAEEKVMNWNAVLMLVGKQEALVGNITVTQVNKKALLSPGTISVRVGQRIDRKRLWQKKNSSSVHFKRDRFKRKHKNTFQQIKAAFIEGETYQPQTEENVSVRDIEKIPTKYSLEGIDEYVVFDLETTGLSRTSDITQISAYDGTNILNLYVSPRQPISSKASDVTGITFFFERNQMYCHSVPVESVCIRKALLQLIEMIQKNLVLCLLVITSIHMIYLYLEICCKSLIC